VTLDGFAPTEAFRKVLALRVGAALTDHTELAGGHPEDFVTAALAGIAALLLLQEGALSLAGGAWSLTGRAATAPRGAAVEQALNAAAAGADWHLEIAVAEPPPDEPTVDPAATPEPTPAPPDFSGPLVFDAVREPGQAIALSGAVPAEA